MRFVPVKTCEQQAALMLVGVREIVNGTPYQLANTIRGYAAEFGLIAAQGSRQDRAAFAAHPDGRARELPALARELFAAHAEEYARARGALDEVSRHKLMAWHRQDEQGRRLAQVPASGPSAPRSSR